MSRLVELPRAIANVQVSANPFVNALESDEDNVVSLQTPQVMIAVNPEKVSAVFGSATEVDVVIVRLADGRGFKVRGNYESVRDALNAPDEISSAS